MPAPEVDFSPDPSLEPIDGNSELVILYHLNQAEEPEVSGDNEQFLMRQELGIDGNSWRHVSTALISRGILQARHRHSTKLNLEQLVRAGDQPFMTPRLLEAVEERQSGFSAAVSQTIALREEAVRLEPAAEPSKPPRVPPRRKPVKRVSKPAAADAGPEGEPSLNAAEKQRARYILGLYRKLQDAVEVALPAKTINRLIRPLRAWEYRTDGLNPPVHYLTRQAMESSIKLKLSEPPTPTRSIHRDEGSITIRVEGDDVRGKDLRTLLRIESQYPRRLLRREMEAKQSAVLAPSEAAVRFREAKGVYVNEGDILTDKETAVLSFITHYNSQTQLAGALGTNPDRLNGKVLKPLRDRAGIEHRPGAPDSYIDLMLLAIGLGVADTDHLPKASKRELDSLNESELELLAHYYSFDPDKRKAAREGRTEEAFSLAWSRLYKKIDVKGQLGRHSAVVYAVRNDILQPPDASTARALLARNDDNVRLA